MGYLTIVNNSDMLIDTDITLTEKRGLKLKKPNRGGVLKLTITPGEHFIALITVGHEGYGFSMKETYTLT